MRVLVMLALSGNLVASSHRLPRGPHPLSTSQAGPAQVDIPTDVEDDDDPLLRPPSSRRKLSRRAYGNEGRGFVFLAMITEVMRQRVPIGGGGFIDIEVEQEILTELPETVAYEAIKGRLKRLLGR